MLGVDWTASRPGSESVEQVLSATDFEVVDVDAPPVEEYVRAMDDTRPRGGVRWCCVEIPESPVIDWFAARNCLTDADFFPHLLSSEPVIDELGLDEAEEPDPEFTVESSLPLDGILAEQLVHGGSRSYGDTVRQEYGTFANAKHLAEACRDEIVEDRYEEVSVHRTREAWCEWFGEQPWNLTLVVVDRRYRWAWIFVATDEGLLEATTSKTAAD